MIDAMDKVYFTPGNVVTLKQDLPNKPVMIVKSKETKTFKDAASTHFIGIKCFWFTADGTYQEQIFNTKDLTHVDLEQLAERKVEEKAEWLDVSQLPTFLGETPTERLINGKHTRNKV